uniref:Small ribosomal subunit protein uS14 n=1 Tax=Anas platyrhynchos TaxID=8839 RepID=A0A8B9ZG44_ANAPL
MGHQQLYWSHPRKFGQGSRSCRVCSNRHGLIRKYGLNMCRQCFRQYAKDIGFIKPADPVPRMALIPLIPGRIVSQNQNKCRCFAASLMLWSCTCCHFGEEG